MRPHLAVAARVVVGFIPVMAAAQSTAIQDVTPMQTEPRPIEDRRLPGTSQTNGDATWNTELARQVYSLCPGEGLIEAMEKGAGMNQAGARQSGACARNTVFVRNDSKLAVQCASTLEYAKPDHSGELRLEADRVIFPMTEVAVIRSYADANNPPKAYTALCIAIPAGPLQPLGTPAECRTSFSGPSPGDFYPPAAKRRAEQGAVTLEFTVTADTIPAEVRVVQSSGFVDLDSAALSFAKHLRAQGSCVGVRNRLKLRFTIAD